MRCPSTTRRFLAALLPAAALTASPLFAAEATRGLAAVHPPGTFDLRRPPAESALTAETQEWRQLRALVGPGDLRRLDAAYVRFNLQSQFSSDPERDPFYDRTRDAVRAGYLKMYREILERQYPVDDLLDDALAALRSSRRRGGGAAAEGPSGPSWRLKVAPRVAVGSNGYLGVRLALPDTGIHGIDRLRLNLRHNVFDGEWALGLRYSHGPRFLQLERVAGDVETGDRYTATVALRF